jgi:hypothetical protein
MKCLHILCSAFVLCLSLSAQNNPIPLLNNPLSPASAAPGSTGLTLNLHGTAFVSGSTVKWNNTALATRFLNSSHLRANVPANLLRTPQTAAVTVVNPVPGGGVSNVESFEVTNAVSPAFSMQSEAYSLSAVETVAGDFNGDGIQDLVVNDGPFVQSVSLMSGRGDGTFDAPVTYFVGPDPSAIVTGDFNKDGKLDTAVTSIDGYVAVLLGNGDGTLQIPVDYPTDIGTSALALGDVNGDGNLDMATVGSDVSILLGNGDGTFRQGARFAKGATLGVVLGDFNRDGHLDLVTSDGQSHLIIYFGKGDGNFTKGSSPSIGVAAMQIAALDLNGDGTIDLIADTGNYNGGSNVITLLGHGDGTFEKPVSYQCCGDPPNAMVVGDIDGDGRADVALPYYDLTTAGYEVAILLANADGTLQQPITYPLTSASAISAADFNNDGRLDLAFGQGLNGTIQIFLGQPN